MQAIFSCKLFIKINTYIFLLVIGTLNASEDFNALNPAQQRALGLSYKQKVQELANILGETPRVTGTDFSPLKARALGLQYRQEFLRLRQLATARGVVLDSKFDVPASKVGAINPNILNSTAPISTSSAGSRLEASSFVAPKDGVVNSTSEAFSSAVIDHIDPLKSIPSLVAPVGA